MLEKGVIQSSTLDWAACPVLVRKKMGASGIDYRGLRYHHQRCLSTSQDRVLFGYPKGNYIHIKCGHGCRILANRDRSPGSP